MSNSKSYSILKSPLRLIFTLFAIVGFACSGYSLTMAIMGIDPPFIAFAISIYCFFSAWFILVFSRIKTVVKNVGSVHMDDYKSEEIKNDERSR